MLEIERLPNILILRLNRPEKRNALNLELLEVLLSALKSAEERVIILQGAGASFCAGLDLKELDRQELLGKKLAEVLQSLYDSPQFVIAAVHGSVYAGGVALMAAADLVVSAQSAEFCLPEVQKGIVPALVGSLLKTNLAQTHVVPLLLLGVKIGASEALEIGLVHEVVSDKGILEASLVLAENALKAAPKTLVKTKKFLKTPLDFNNVLQIHLDGRETEEAKEGLAAFNEKRKPFWNN